MIVLSERFTLIFLLVSNGVLIAAGVGMIGQGMYRLKAPSATLGTEGRQGDAPVSITTGSFDIIVAVCGVVGALLKKRILLIINVALLASVIIWDIFIMSATGAAGTKAEEMIARDVKRVIIEYYGNNSDSHGREVTNDADAQQREESCCGWSSSDGENVFLQTPWYRLINTNATRPTGKLRTLPDSCCAKAGPECNSAENLKEARNSGFVNKVDCLEKVIMKARISMWFLIIHLMLMTLLHMVVLAFSGLILLQNATVPSEQL